MKKHKFKINGITSEFNEDDAPGYVWDAIVTALKNGEEITFSPLNVPSKTLLRQISEGRTWESAYPRSLM